MSNGKFWKCMHPSYLFLITDLHNILGFFIHSMHNWANITVPTGFDDLVFFSKRYLYWRILLIFRISEELIMPILHCTDTSKLLLISSIRSSTSFCVHWTTAHKTRFVSLLNLKFTRTIGFSTAIYLHTTNLQWKNPPSKIFYFIDDLTLALFFLEEFLRR